MAAPGPPVAGSVAQTTSKFCSPDFPATVNTNDILVIWAAAISDGTAPTTFTWPSGFTEGVTVPLKNSVGTTIGLAGWAWKRSTDGSEAGTGYTVERDGTGGTGGHFMANSCAIPGCITTGNPYAEAVSNNPNAVSPSPFPDITTTVAESMLLSFRLLSGNTGNYGTFTNWTLLVSNQGTGGADSAHDVDYRQLSSTGTYNPGSPSASIDADTAWATFQVAFIPPSSGGTSHALVGSAAGGSTTSGTLRQGHALAGSAAGGSTTSGILSQTHGLAGAAAGSSGATGALKRIVNLIGSVAGSSGATGTLRQSHALSGQSDGDSGAIGSLTVSGALAVLKKHGKRLFFGLR